MKIVKKEIRYTDEDTAVVIGRTQPGDIVIDAGFYVEEAFNGTTPVIDMGFAADNQGGTADPNALASALSPIAVGHLSADEIASTTNKRCTVGDEITCTFSVASGTPSTGIGVAWAMIVNEY